MLMVALIEPPAAEFAGERLGTVAYTRLLVLTLAWFDVNTWLVAVGTTVEVPMASVNNGAVAPTV